MRQHWLRLLLSRDSFERSCTCTVFENEQKRSHNATFNRVSLDQSYLFEFSCQKCYIMVEVIFWRENSNVNVRLFG